MSEPFVYRTKPKGPPAFSGRSQATMHANLASQRKERGVSKQQKQKGKK